MNKRFLAILAGIVIIFIVVVAITQGSNNNQQSTTPKNNRPTSHIEGQGKTNVTLMEYGDYQCSACKVFEPVVRQVYERFSQDIYFQFRNLPLSIHQNAYSAARAAEAAGLQNKYWQMHDKLYDNQDSWANANDALSIFKAYAAELGLNTNQFGSDYASSRVNDATQADMAAFNKTGQQMTTPTFFLDGKYINNSDLMNNGLPSVDKFASVVNNEIAKHKQ